MRFLSILKLELKKNFKSILKTVVFLALFMLMYMSMFDPELFAGMEDIMDSFPAAMLDLVGGTFELSTLAGFLTMEFLSMIWIWVGIYIILKAAQDIPTEIDNKTIDLILSKPIKRWEYSLGKHLRFIITIFIIFFAMLLVVAAMVPVLPNLADEVMIWKDYITTFFWAFLFILSLECTAFFFSTFMPRKKASGAAFAMLVLLFIIGIFYGYFDESIQNIKYISLFYYYDPGRIMIEHNYIDLWVDFTVLIVYSLVLSVASVLIFNKRDIPV